jgi:transcriptional regulator with PAS, ATPase and Fis domain
VHIIEGVLNIVNKHLILVNEDGEIIFISDNFSENIGYKVKELIGKNMNCLVPLEFRDKHLNSFKKLVIDIKDCCNTFNVLKSRNIPLVKKDNTLISVSLGVWFIGYDYVKFSKKIFAAIIGEI